MKVIYFLSFVALTLSSCNKDEVDGATNVEIVFTEPSVNDTVFFSNQVHAEGTIVGDKSMEGYTLSLINESNGTVLYTNTYNVQSDSYNFHEHWTNNLSDTTLVKIRVEVTKDKNGNKATKETHVVCLP